MNRTAHLVFVMGLLPLLGCPKKSDAAADAAAEAAVAVVVDAGPEASNEAKLTHYKDETAIDHQPATVKTAKALALTAVPKGDTAFTLKSGDSVTQVSEHNGYFLVLFPDPADGSKKLAGWVPKFAFMDPPVQHKAKLPKCADGLFLVSDKTNPISPRCSKMCEDDSDCPSGKCETAVHLDDKGNPAMINSVSTNMSVCTALVVKDAGPTKPVSVPKCAADETHYAMSEGAPIFCSKDSCSADKDCKGGAKCTEVIVIQDDGEPARTMHGSMMSDHICRK